MSGLTKEEEEIILECNNHFLDFIKKEIKSKGKKVSITDRRYEMKDNGDLISHKVKRYGSEVKSLQKMDLKKVLNELLDNEEFKNPNFLFRSSILCVFKEKEEYHFTFYLGGSVTNSKPKVQ